MQENVLFIYVLTTNQSVTIWFILGIALITAEFLFPYFVIIFFGLGAITTGIFSLLGLPEHSGIPVGVFAGSSLFLLLTLRKVAKRMLRGSTTDTSDIQSGFDDIIGSEAVALSEFDGELQSGCIEFRGSVWNAFSENNLKKGDRVVIISRKKHHLKVEKITPP